MYETHLAKKSSTSFDGRISVDVLCYAEASTSYPWMEPVTYWKGGGRLQDVTGRKLVSTTGESI
jgi:hypothetical protein